jgi:hypothetical protein
MPSGDHGVALSLIRHNSVMAVVRRGDARWRLVGRDCLDPSSRKGRVCCTHGFLTVGPISSITVLLVIWRAWRLGSLGSADLFWWVGQPGWSVAFGLGVNKGSGSRVPLVTRQRSTSCLSSLILARVSCSGGSAGELPWACYAWSLLDSVGFGRARPFFSSTGWFMRERRGALLFIALACLVIWWSQRRRTSWKSRLED